jgi:uncharacterized protein YodC (DUF2158 family)
MAQFKPGDTVRLKSGGPLMTIHTVRTDGTAWCEWFDKNGKAESREFSLTSLALDDGGPVVG